MELFAARAGRYPALAVLIPRPAISPVYTPAGGETHPHHILLIEGEGVVDKDNSIRSLARDASVSRMREFAVPPCTRAFALVNAGCRREVALLGGASGSCRRGLH